MIDGPAGGPTDGPTGDMRLRHADPNTLCGEEHGPLVRVERVGAAAAGAGAHQPAPEAHAQPTDGPFALSPRAEDAGGKTRSHSRRGSAPSILHTTAFTLVFADTRLKTTFDCAGHDIT
eukprot:7627222-Pyramimonas_sp.AAC.2